MATNEKHTSVWLIIPQTNLHVGNESIVNFSVIDKAIQRDVTTGFPCINSSSLKGAIKEYLTIKADNETKKEEIVKKEKEIVKLFGSIKKTKDEQEKTDESKDKQKTKENKKGSALFFDATLLAIPEQKTKGNSPYQLVYSEKVINDFLAKAKVLGVTINIDTSKWEQKDKGFEELCSDDNLPIIARNCLENGESTNLWYEQVLPAQSVLATIIQTNGKDDLKELENAIVQIGANATIGYGYCKFIKL